MKTIFFLPLFIFLIPFSVLWAQEQEIPLPPSTLIPHYLVHVAFNTTTVLVFPAMVKPVDRGDRDVLAQKQAGVENVLKLKAARKYFPTTNLHVFTADGKIYAFDIMYTDSLAQTRDLTSLGNAQCAIGTQPLVLLSEEPVNSAQMEKYVAEIKANGHLHHRPADHRDQMTLRLEKINQGGPLLFLRFQIANHSNLDYSLDFIRMYIRDRQKAKRTSVQEKEILPIYEDSTRLIPGNASVTHVLGVPAFTLAGGKECIVEAYEKNGGRALRLRIKNKTLLQAKKL